MIDPSEAHWRLYRTQSGISSVVSVQDFDYVDYEASGWLSEECFENHDEAKAALRTHLLTEYGELTLRISRMKNELEDLEWQAEERLCEARKLTP